MSAARPSLRLRARFGLAFGALLALLLLVAGAALLQMRALARVEAQQGAMEQLQRDVLQWSAHTELNVTRSLALARAGSPPAPREWMNGQMKATSATISKLQQRLEQSVADAKGKALLQAVAAARKDYVDLRTSLLQRLAKPGEAAAAQAEVSGKLQPAAAAYLDSLEAVRAHAEDLASEQERAQDALLKRAFILLPAIALAAVLLGAVLAWRLSAGFLRVVEQLRAAARRVAEGDLTQPVAVDRADEFGELQQALAQMQASLVSMVDGIREGTDGVGTAATQIASGNDDLSARTERAASNLQQTAATMAHLSDTMRDSSGSAGKAQQLAQDAVAVARRGGEVVSEVVSTMAAINAESGRISEITGVIDSIAFQTNILALNAAVEAARAGDEGRGFAVVAAEVRNLASRCADAAREIRGLIENNVRRAEDGARLVQSAGATMQEIESGVQHLTQAISGVTVATQSQATGFGEVNQAVAQLDQITQQNAALVEESAAAAQGLRDQALALVRMVSSFRLAAAH